jgi:hypothetical protein
VGLLDVGLGAAAVVAEVGAEVSGTVGGAEVHPAASVPATTRPTARRGIPIP